MANDKYPTKDNVSKDKSPDEDVRKLMENHDLDQDTVERVQ